MSAPRDQTCEVKVDGAWRAVSLDKAQLRHPNDLKCCPARHWRVLIMGTYGSLRRLAMAHRRGHDGCPLRPLHYQGVATRHPEAVK